jgi:hypothetical protein
MAVDRLAAVKRHYLFALWLAPGILLMVVLKRLSVAPDIAVGLMFVPALIIFIWNRAQGGDRLQRLAAPTLALSASISLGGFTQYKNGALFELLHLAGLIGVFLSIGWLFWHLLFLGGQAKQR